MTNHTAYQVFPWILNWIIVILIFDGWEPTETKLIATLCYAKANIMGFFSWRQPWCVLQEVFQYRNIEKKGNQKKPIVLF